MKLFSLVIIASIILNAQANACDNKIDPNRVILFIDTNTSEPEIDRAQKAACIRGENLVIIPKNISDYKKLVETQSRTELELNSCEKKKGKDACQGAHSKASDAYNALQDYVQSQGKIPEQAEKVLEEIRQRGGKIQTLIISGHDGGGKFGGLKGSFDKNDMKALLDEFSDINEIKSLLLLGCYTGVQKEILDWKSIFPNIALIGGYDGSAPLSNVPAGQQYLTDLLLKGPALIEQAKQKKINNFAKKNLSEMLNLNAALYLQCGEDTNFYYSSKNRELGFNQFNMKACENVSKLKEIEAALAKYDNGDIEPPKDTANGALRKLYNEARALEHCFELKNINVSLNRVFNLLFYNGIKQSFGHFYKDKLIKAEEALKTIDYKVLAEKVLEALKVNQDKLLKLHNEKNLLETNLPSYIEQKKNEAEEAQKKKQMAYLLLSKEAKSVISMDDQIDFMKLQSLNPKDAALVKAYQKELYASFEAKIEFEKVAKDPEQSKSTLAYQITGQENQIAAMKGFVAGFSGKKEEVKKLWIPTQANLSQKSRKETLENLHVMSYALSLSGLTAEQKEALQDAHHAAQNHLVYFQNPFSWHEYNGRKVADPSENE